MRSSENLSDQLAKAFATSGTISTIGTKGNLVRRSLADLVLPTGRIGIGYPGEGEIGRLINSPSSVVPEVKPGRYPVFISLAVDGPYASFAFLSIIFEPISPESWQSAGGFFTDSGDGAVYDVSLTSALQKNYSASDELRLHWRQIKRAALEGGDGNLLLDSDTGANAILFATHDFGYPAHTGHDASGKIVCLVIDGSYSRD